MQKDRFWNKGSILYRPLRREFGNVMQYFTKMTQKAGAALMILCIVAGSAQFSGITVQASEAEIELSQDNKTEESSFDLAISSLYRDSGELTDSEILDASKKITSDAGVLLSSVDEKESRQVVKALDTFEEQPGSTTQIRPKLQCRIPPAQQTTDRWLQSGTDSANTHR